MNVFGRKSFLIVALGLTACGGGGGVGVGSPASCVFVPGSISMSEYVGQNLVNPAHLNDGNLSSFASIGDSGTVCCGNQSLTIRDKSGTEFPSGTKAGIYISLPTGTTSGNIAISTYLNGSIQDTATGAALGDVQNPGASPATDYFFVNTTKPFNEIDLSVTGNQLGEIDMFEFCADAQE